uniref:hypothetical protein n=1 Tax=Nocardia cyriacigeorgica TaxID=135487 RepID=UPI003CC80937
MKVVIAGSSGLIGTALVAAFGRAGAPDDRDGGRAMGFYTLNGGLELAGSPLAASRITESIGFEPPAADASAAVVADGVQT